MPQPAPTDHVTAELPPGSIQIPQLTVPVAPGRLVHVAFPPGMTEDEWQRMFQVLEFMKPGIVIDAEEPDPDAAAVEVTRDA